MGEGNPMLVAGMTLTTFMTDDIMLHVHPSYNLRIPIAFVFKSTAWVPHLTCARPGVFPEHRLPSPVLTLDILVPNRKWCLFYDHLSGHYQCQNLEWSDW